MEWYGAACIHSLEGLFLEPISTVLTVSGSGLSDRMGMILSAYITSSLKAVADHGGYVFPWNPTLLYSENDAKFHHLHHRRCGLKVK